MALNKSKIGSYRPNEFLNPQGSSKKVVAISRTVPRIHRLYDGRSESCWDTANSFVSKWEVAKSRPQPLPTTNPGTLEH